MNALVMTDIQNDFVPAGALAVPEGDRIVPIVNHLAQSDFFDIVLATQDWHPANHGSFAANHPGKKIGDVIDLGGLEQILWPVHCVQNTPGAAFVKELDTSRVERVFQKGTDPTIDSYSALFDNGHRKSTGLGEYMKSRGVSDVYFSGLATDYCVKYSALDACRLGFAVHLIRDACRGIDLHRGDIEAAIDEMAKAGVQITKSQELK